MEEICKASALDGALEGIAHCFGSRGDGDGVFMVHFHGIGIVGCCGSLMLSKIQKRESAAS